MWSRQEIKEIAKEKLRASYWTPFFISIALAISLGGLSGSRYTLDKAEFSGSGLILIPILLWGIGATIFGLGLMIFIFAPLETGCRKSYLEYVKGNENLNEIFFAFRSPNYMNIVKAMLITRVKIVLYTLLFIIPGLIKTYQYRFVPFLLAENPEMDAYEAMAQSTDMTEGHKMNLFVMDLSFVGWYILGAMALGVGVLFVNPYRDTSISLLYERLQEKLN